jgi:hypothetical protein
MNASVNECRLNFMKKDVTERINEAKTDRKAPVMISLK